MCVDWIVAAMVHHTDSIAIASGGVYFLYNLSLEDANVPTLRAAGVVAAVCTAIARYGSADGGKLKRYGDLVLTRL